MAHAAAHRFRRESEPEQEHQLGHGGLERDVGAVHHTGGAEYVACGIAPGAHAAVGALRDVDYDDTPLHGFSYRFREPRRRGRVARAVGAQHNTFHARRAEHVAQRAFRYSGKDVDGYHVVVHRVVRAHAAAVAVVAVEAFAVVVYAEAYACEFGIVAAAEMSGMPTAAVMALLVLGGMLMTQFTSNTVSMYLFYAVTIALLASSGINMPAFVIIVALGAMMGLVTPAAAVPSPLFFGPEHINMKNTAKYAVIYLLLTFVALMVLIWPLANVLIKF